MEVEKESREIVEHSNKENMIMLIEYKELRYEKNKEIIVNTKKRS